MVSKARKAARAAKKAVRKERVRLAREAGVQVGSGAFGARGGSFSKGAARRSLQRQAEEVTVTAEVGKPVLAVTGTPVVKEVVLPSTRERIATAVRPEIRTAIRRAAEPPGISRTPAAIERIRRAGEKVSEKDFGSRFEVFGLDVLSPRESGRRVAGFVREELSGEKVLRSGGRASIGLAAVDRVPKVSRVSFVSPSVAFEPVPTGTFIKAVGIGLGAAAVRTGREVFENPLGFVTETAILTGTARGLKSAILAGEERGFVRTIERIDRPSVDPRLRFDPRAGTIVSPLRPSTPVVAPTISVSQAKLKVEVPPVAVRGVLRDGRVQFFEEVKVLRRPPPTVAIPITAEVQTVLPSGLRPVIAVKEPRTGFGFVATVGEAVGARIPSFRGRRGSVSLLPLTSSIFRGGEELVSIIKRSKIIPVRIPSFVSPSGISRVSPLIVPAIPIVAAPVVGVSAVGEVLKVGTGRVARLAPIVSVKPVSILKSRITPISIVTPIAIPDVKSRSKGREKVTPISIVSSAVLSDVVSEAPPIAKVVPRVRVVSKVLFEPFRFITPKTSVVRTRERFTPSISPRALPRAFEVFVTRMGRERRVGTGLGRFAALSLGTKVTSESLAATFRIRPTGGVARRLAPFGPLPSPAKFRTFRIKGGKRIPLVDTFIERRGKRLSTRGEIGEILKAKKKKKGVGFL